ncbi:division/cell wall cluster transcriptional repressor MraZ [bacterium]|nr:division/cell wall cluster transcriptional repressor MraZ [bacterium]MBU4561279.1 division/cell wall cluster transcriptional repressor MraZ [bacterium]MCG2676656.1 division/cell wall cluster transcriptional repressor MraZ [bacterium]
MYLGEYRYSLDQKGRLVLPAKLRGKKITSFVLTRGLDRCLFLYPLDEWKGLEKKIRELPMAKREARSFLRLLVSGAVESRLDRQGRLLVTKSLAQYARIEKEVVIIGALNRIEIWAKKSWEEYLEKSERSFEEIAQKLVDLGI